MTYICTNCDKKVNDAFITEYGDFCSKYCRLNWLERKKNKEFMDDEWDDEWDLEDTKSKE